MVSFECMNESMVLQGAATIVTDGERVAMIVVYTVCVISAVLNLLLFLYYKNNFARTKLRVSLFSFTYLAGLLTFATGFVLPLITGFDRFPCWLSYALTSACLAFFTATNFTRNTTFMLMTRLSIATMKHGKLSLDITNAAEARLASLSTLERMKEDLRSIWFGFRFVLRTNAVQNVDNTEDHLRTLITLKYVTGTRGALFFTLFITLPFLIAIAIVCIAIPVYRNGCTGCATDSPPTVYTVIGGGAALASFAVLFAIKCRSLPDVWGVFAEGRLSARGVVVSCIGFMIVSFAKFPQKYYVNIVAVGGFTVGFYFATFYQVIVAMKTEGGERNARRLLNHHAGKTSSVIDSTSDSASVSSPVSDIKSCRKLNEILSAPELSKMFANHLGKEFAQENLNFLQETADWRNTFSDVSRSASFAIAKKLVSTYISSEGLRQINLPANISKYILTIVKEGNSEKVARDLFDPARNEIAKLLETGPVTRFMRTPEYTTYLSATEVISAVS